MNAPKHIWLIQKAFVLCTSMVLYFGTTTAQTVFGTYSLEHWDARRGLPTNQVLNLNTDNEGYIWISGYDGLIRFDGQRFKVFDVSTNPEFIVNNTYTAFMDKKGALWVTVINNTILSYQDGKFKPYRSPWIISRPEIILKQEALLFYNASNEYVLFDCIQRRFSKLDQEQLVSTIQSNVSNRGIVRDPKGNIFFISNRRLYKIAADHKMQALDIEANVSDEGGMNHSEIFKDYLGIIHLISDLGHWVWNGSRFVKNPGTEHIHFQTFGSSRKPLIVEDQQQNLWMASVQGLVLRRKGQKHFEFLPPNHPLSNEFVNSMVVDRENNLWLATESGLYKVSSSKVRVYSIYDGLSSKRVTAAAALDSGTYIINTPGTQNFHWLSKGKLSPFKLQNEPSRSLEIFHALTDSKKRTWFVTGGALIVVYPDKSNHIYYSSYNIRYVYEDPDGKIWFGISGKGIGQWMGDSIKILDFPGHSFEDKMTSSIHRYGKKGWIITTFNDGVVLIDDNQQVRYLSDTLGLPPIGAFNALVEPDGTFWLPTSLGLYYWNGQRFLAVLDYKRYLQYNLFDIVEDRLGNFWLPTNKGIVRVKKADLLHYIKSNDSSPVRAHILDEGDGMLSRQCVGARHSVLTPDGKILVPTFFGLVEIDPHNHTQNKISPKVSIEPIRFDGKAVNLGQPNIFPPGNHQYVLSYGALSTTSPSKVRYRYRLEGYKNYWSELTLEDRVTYTNLPAGKYTFRVKAANNDGVWSEKEAILSFSIRPFFYQTWWFWLFSVLILVFGVQKYIGYRNRSILLKNEDLERTIAHRTQALQEANQDLETQKTSLEETLDNLKSTQDQLIQSEKLASLGELIAGIAHEIQNPLNFVNNFAEVSTEILAEMKEEIKAGNTTEVIVIADDLEQNLSKINHHGQRASSIVKGMLEHSRQGRDVARKVSTDINALADEYLRLAYHGWRAKDSSFNCKMETDFDPDLPPVEVIPQDMGRVLLNLINNAFYAVQQRAVQALHATSSLPYQPTVTVSTQQLDDQIIIRVADNGSGIPEPIREKIFQPFFTTKPPGQGTGLGLSLAYDIITKGHRGTFRVESELGSGTTFIIGLAKSSQS